MPRVKEEVIEIVGADANNLQDIDVSFPIGKVSMVVGVSGSGKSSLLQNTLAREGNLRLKTFLGIDQGLGLPRSQAFISSTPPTLYVGQNAFHLTAITAGFLVITTVGSPCGQFHCFSLPVMGGPWPKD
jgi:hypothetical protein